MNQTDKRLSIIIPVYNAEKYIARCLDSILSQGVWNLEIVCVNDGSRDGSLALLREYEARYPEVMKVIDQENGGVSVARNTALAVASGDYITFADADDYLEPESLVAAFALAVEKGHDMTVFSFYRIDRNGRKRLIKVADKQYDTADYVRLINNLGSTIFNGLWNKIYRSEVVRNVRLKEGMKMCEDGHFNYRVLLGCRSVCTASMAVYNYELGYQSATSKFYGDAFFEVNSLIDTARESVIKRVEEVVSAEKRSVLDKQKARLFETCEIQFAYEFLFELYAIHRSAEPRKLYWTRQMIAKANEARGCTAWQRHLQRRVPGISRILMPYPVLLHWFLTFVFWSEGVVNKMRGR